MLCVGLLRFELTVKTPGVVVAEVAFETQILKSIESILADFQT